MEQKITIGNVCFIRHPSQEKVLLLQRSRDPIRGKYTGVGGKAGFFEDIRSSCIREVLEETGLTIQNLELKGVVKTIHDGFSSSWILFVYVAQATEEQFVPCDEGTLQWVNMNDISSVDLIGFIRAILPNVFRRGTFFEGRVTHDIKGDVISEEIVCTSP